MRVALALVVVAGAAFMLYGWGWAARRLFRASEASWPVTIASGMAALVFLGGVLNLARLARPWALGCIAIAGLAIGISRIRRPEMSVLSRVLIPAMVLIFVILTQVPPRAYNFHDDFQKYFAHPVRMLETGTVFGSPLNDIGLDTLGGQAFLDGFSVAFFPIQYINGVDAALALFLCMMLACEFKSILATLSVFVINPQYVNISALYTGSFLMMGAVMEESPAILGLFYAALIALKSTFVLFVAVHWLVRRNLRSVAFTALFLAPWILLHAPHYVQFLHAAAPIADHGVCPLESFNIFSIAPLDYGGTPLAYTGLMISVAICGAILWKTKHATAAACLAMLAAYLIMVYVTGPRNAGYDQAIRYFAPFAVAIAPVAFGAASASNRWLVTALAAVCLLGFAPSLLTRVEQSIHSGSELAFTWLAPTPEYLEYNREVLSGDVRQRVAAAQAKIPAGEEAVVWINTPFFLDYARNPLADVEPGAGLIAPWSKIPRNARYFIWEYNGYANMDEADYVDAAADGPDYMRRVSAARLSMTRRLRELMQAAPEKLYDDGSIAVFISAGR